MLNRHHDNISNKIKMLIIGLCMGVVMGLIAAAQPSPALAQSLYEYYATKTSEDLSGETREMGGKIKNLFNRRYINEKQQEIDFEEYHSNLKKVVHFSNKLSSYTEYEKDLTFAKDNEIFKGLPEVIAVTEGKNETENRKSYVAKKYDRMKKNVEDEVDTYLDMINTSLDACEALSINDLSGFTMEKRFYEKMEEFMRSEAVQRYMVIEKRIGDKWPDLSIRTARQFQVWAPEKISPESPIIDKDITGAFLK